MKKKNKKQKASKPKPTKKKLKEESTQLREQSKELIEELKTKEEPKSKEVKKKKTSSFKEKIKKKKRARFKIQRGLTSFLEKAGYDENIKEFHKKIIVVDVVLVGIILLFTSIMAVIVGTRFDTFLLIAFLIVTLVAIGIYLISLLVVFFFLDLKMYQRTKEVESVLPDFLQLTSANISAGMPIDRALWLAVRPRFGILGKEIEQIAKATLAGEDLEVALEKFSDKYNSRMLRESINLLIAGLEAGGEIADLLNKISINIQETRLMEKEIAANVMTYVIFISVATIAAAPFLFALSGQLLGITQGITSGLELDSTSTSSFNSFNFTGEGISLATFNSFAILMMVISSIFSVSIISVIRKGNVKEGLKLIPIFIAVSFAIFYSSTILFNYVLGGFFA